MTKSRKTTLVLLVMVIVLLTVILTIIGVLFVPAKMYVDAITLGNKYLQEMDYENAKIAYLKCINIDPKKPESYLNLSYVYEANGEYDKALEILQSAEKNADMNQGFTATLEKQRDKIEVSKEKAAASQDDEKDENAEGVDDTQESGTLTREDLYAKYREVIKDSENKYGVMSTYQLAENSIYPVGLCYMKLMDFDVNGMEELVLIYTTPYAEVYYGYQYHFEVWGQDGSEVRMLDSGEPAGHDGAIAMAMYSRLDGRVYLLSGGTDYGGSYDLHGYNGSEFGAVHHYVWDTWSGDADQSIYTIDGVEVSENQWNQIFEEMPVETLEFHTSDLEKIEQTNEDTRLILGME